MKKVVCSVLLLCLTSQILRADIILTKRGRKYNGKVIRITEKAFVVRTVEGTVIGVPKADITKILRGNQVLDFEQGVRYHLEVRRPFLPFIVLSIATGAYAIKRYQDYKDHKDQAEAELLKDAGSEYTNLNDQSKKDLAWCIISGLFSLGSLYVALRPMEVRVPMGRINLGMTSRGVTLALHF